MGLARFTSRKSKKKKKNRDSTILVSGDNHRIPHDLDRVFG